MEEADENGCQHFRSEKALRAKQVKDRPWVFTEPPWLHSLGREVARYNCTRGIVEPCLGHVAQAGLLR